MNAREIGIGEPHLLEAAAARGVGALRAERADVEAFRAQRHRERRIVELRIVRQCYDRRAVVGLQPLQSLVGPFGREFQTGEARFGGKGLPGVDDDRLVIGEA